MKYGSDFARAWSRRLHFGDVRAKSLLNAISNYADEDGCACPSIRTLAEDTDQSDDSVRRRLKDLQEFGVIARTPRYVDSAGKINSIGPGRRTSDEIRLLFDADQASVDAAKARRTPDSDEADEADPSQQRGSAEEADPSHGRGSDPSQQPGRPSTAATGVSTEPEKEELPPTPLTGGRSGEPPNEEKWGAFVAAFTGDGEPIGRPSIAKPIFVEMSASDQQTAIQAALGYIAIRKAAKRAPPQKMAAQTFLRERDAWAGWASHAPSATAARAAAGAFDRPWWWLVFEWIWRHRAVIKDRDSAAGRELRKRLDTAVSMGLGWQLTDLGLPEVEEAAMSMVKAMAAGPEYAAWRAALFAAYRIDLPMPSKTDWVWLPCLDPNDWQPMAAQEHEEA